MLINVFGIKGINSVMNIYVVICFVTFSHKLLQAQIINGREKYIQERRTDDVNFEETQGSQRASTSNDRLESAVAKLTDSVSLLSDRLTKLEENLQFKFQVFGESLVKEKVSIENIYSRLDVLDNLSTKINQVESKVENETAIITEALVGTNKDVHRLATQLEELEHRSPIARERDAYFYTKNGYEQGNTRGAAPPARNETLPADSLSKEKEIGAMVLEKVERILPRLLAAELNHFYLNMATKTDHSIGQLQRELVMRLRRIEGTTKKSLSEIQDGRQDISHVTHLQRTVVEKQTALLRGSIDTPGRPRCDETQKTLESFVRQVYENFTIDVAQTIKDAIRGAPPTTEDRSHRDKGGVAQPSLSSTVWSGVFSTGLNRQPSSLIVSSPVSTKHCLDPTAFSTLQEVKQLLRSLMSKGEDLRRTLTKQANEGVDLLKLLHQRFSVLLRRINTEPNHAEALLAEVQELEHLVENSYSSILLAQNVFIESCRRIQQEQPSIEGQIVDILNKLVTNIDLGHQFNRKQLQELRELIEKMNSEDESKHLSLIPSWISVNRNSTKAKEETSNFKDKFLKNFALSAAEANNTEIKLTEILDRINVVENELKSLSWKPANAKNTIDELLTGVKDLKGYSKDQIQSLQVFQQEILHFMDSVIMQEPFLSRENLTKEARVSANSSNKIEKNKRDELIKIQNYSRTDNSCDTLTFLRSLNLSTVSYYKSLILNTSSEEEFIDIIEQLITHTAQEKYDVLTLPGITTSKPSLEFSATKTTMSTLGKDEAFENEDKFYYDLDPDEMFMDDDHSWSNVYDEEMAHYTDQEESYSNEEININKRIQFPLNLKKSIKKKKLNSVREITMLENDFTIA